MLAAIFALALLGVTGATVCDGVPIRQVRCLHKLVRCNLFNNYTKRYCSLFLINICQWSKGVLLIDRSPWNPDQGSMMGW